MEEAPGGAGRAPPAGGKRREGACMAGSRPTTSTARVRILSALQREGGARRPVDMPFVPNPHRTSLAPLIAKGEKEHSPAAMQKLSSLIETTLADTDKRESTSHLSEAFRIT